MLSRQTRIGCMLNVLIALMPIVMVFGLTTNGHEPNRQFDIDVDEIIDFNPIEITLTKLSKENRNSTAVFNGIHDLFLGAIGHRDSKLLDVTLYAPRRRFRQVKKTIRYPHHSSQNRRNITAIRALDLSHNGTGGYPRLTAGGIGYKYAYLTITSQWSQGLYYRLEIWGR
ncbi:uncharacterized protein LOC120349869 [Nilaparvata lugens]|uniref:uncharacterized protein LOC120349869 n=1 Tax=Nilaparvata lugens TaxID=108931 RepID=UPI00193DC3EE|nr:uncharacterized protein LOC120349869 [Nilaparvata lugens]